MQELVLHIGNDSDALHLVRGKLGLYIEGTDAIHLIPKKLDAIGFLMRKGKHIHNTAAH